MKLYARIAIFDSVDVVTVLLVGASPCNGKTSLHYFIVKSLEKDVNWKHFVLLFVIDDEH